MTSEGSFRGDIAPGPITYAEVAQAQGYDHRLLRIPMNGRDVLRLREAARAGTVVSGPSAGRIDPGARYTVAANELLATGDSLPALREAAPGGRPVGSEIEALAWYLERHPRSSAVPR